MAINDVTDWAILHVAGGKTIVGDLPSLFSFDLAISLSQTEGVVLDISGFPNVKIPTTVKVVPILVAGAVTEFTIAFDGTLDAFAISGSMTIGVEADAQGTCNYEFQDGKAPLNVVNAVATWLQHTP